MSDIRNYTREMEDLYIQFFKADPDLFLRCLTVIRPHHYRDLDNKKTIEFILEHSSEFGAMPNDSQILAVCGKTIEPMTFNEGNKEWFLVEYENFAKHREMEIAIYAAPDLIEKGHYGEAMTLVKEAAAISLVRDLGTDYFHEPEQRINNMEAKNGSVSTGFKAIDKKLNGGTNRGELSIVAGQSGTGKSLFLQNMAVNWAMQGMNVVYLSLELSEDLCALRLDAMITRYSTTEVWKNRGEVNQRVLDFAKEHNGSMRIKQMKNGSTANDIKAFLKEYEIQTNIRPDAICLDYLDLCMPTNAKISPENLFVKDKYVTENLRDLAVELDTHFFTASQLNRGSYEEDMFSHASISGGMSKINTADNVLAIYTTPAMKESGRYQIQFMKTRSSSGVGSSIDLSYSPKTMRMSDCTDDGGELGSTAAETRSVMEQLQKSKSVSNDTGKDVSHDNVVARTASLKSFLDDNLD